MLVPGALVDGKYRIVRLLGEGGMGVVYEGENVRIARRVAIKVMHPAIARDRALVGRFEREAQAAAKIGSAHVADVLDLGDLPGGARYLVMEFLEGENLHTRLVRRRFLGPVDVSHIAIQLLEGLAMVHDAGIVHRDLKPPNVFLAKKGDAGDFVKILDFGICKMLTRASLSDGTGGGDLLGTLSYMSPEQFAHGSRKIDARADIYSVGVILYRCVTGNVPFRGTTLVEHARLMKEGKAQDVRELAPDVDAGFAQIVHRAIEKDPAKRFPSARALQSELVGWTNRANRIEHLLSDYLGTKLRSEPPKEAAVVPPRATQVKEEDVFDTDPDPVPTPTRIPRKKTRTQPMRNAPTLPTLTKPTIPTADDVKTTRPRKR